MSTYYFSFPQPNSEVIKAFCGKYFDANLQAVGFSFCDYIPGATGSRMFVPSPVGYLPCISVRLSLSTPESFKLPLLFKFGRKKYLVAVYSERGGPVSAY